MKIDRLIQHTAIAVMALVLYGVAHPALAQTATTRSTPCSATTLPNEICLTWTAVTTRIDGLPTTFPITYKVEQQVGTGAFASIQTVSVTRAYVKNLAPGDYTYRVTAIENAIESLPSNTASKSVVQAAPNAPVIVIAVLIRDGQDPVTRVLAQVTPAAGEQVFLASK